MTPDNSELLAVIERFALAAGALAVDWQARLTAGSVSSKGHLDLVSEADKAIEAFLTREILREFPDDGVQGEEGDKVDSRSGRIWIIDPIDGTFNFVRGSDQWAIAIGVHEAGAARAGVIHAPQRLQTLTGAKGLPARFNGEPLAPLAPIDASRAAAGVGYHPAVPIDTTMAMLRYLIDTASMTFRQYGSATISLIELARGEVDGFIGLGVSSWDVIAAMPALEALGATCNVDWAKVDLRAKLRFACGVPAFTDSVAHQPWMAGPLAI